MSRPVELIRAATESVLAQIDMGLVDPTDGDALVDAMCEEMGRYMVPTTPLDSFSTMVGGAVSCVLYEVLHIKGKTGEYSEFITEPPEGQD